jgi:hypothetical protein
MKKKDDPNARRDPDQTSNTFWLSSEHRRKLDELAAASRFTKTALVRHWIDTEHAKQSKSGNLELSPEPFPESSDVEQVNKSVRGKRRSPKNSTRSS